MQTRQPWMWPGTGMALRRCNTGMRPGPIRTRSSPISPRRETVRIEKRGDYFYAFVSGSDGKLQVAGASTKLALTGPFYIGIGVCAHDKDVVEKAVFSNVKLVSLPPATGKPVLYSTLETITVASTDRRVAYVAPVHFEAPNWSRDGGFLLFNSEGRIRRLAVNGTDPATIDHRSRRTAATTITAFRPTASGWRSATPPEAIRSRPFTSCRLAVEHRGR